MQNITDKISTTSTPSFVANSSQNEVINSGPLFEKANSELAEIYIYPFVFVIIYMVIGFWGNVIVIYIFTAKWKLTKTTIFILTLAGVDLMSCAINMPTEAAILWHPLDFDYDVICKISRYTTFIASASSSFVLIAISIDRYLMICRPFLGRELGVRYAKRTCLVAVLLGIVTTWPPLIFYGTYSYQVDVTNNQTGGVVKVEGKTCLITNFYVDHYKLPAGFYFFLFGAHAIMFVMLTFIYMLIGRRLYISTSGAISNEEKKSLKYFGISMMSAITGSVPTSPADSKDRTSWGSRSSRAASLENINRIDRSVSFENVNRVERGTKNVRHSNETNVTIVLNCDDAEKYCKVNDMLDTTCSSNPEHGKNADKMQTLSETSCDNRNLGFNNIQCQSPISDESASDSSLKVNDNRKRRTLLSLNLGRKDQCSSATANGRLSSGSSGSGLCMTSLCSPATANGRLSSGSSGSGLLMTPLSPTTPASADSVRGILYRSQSVESRARLNRIISDELRRAEVKETSLRRNTLIMRMVTIAFVVSFLPYLVIVTLRYSNSDIPTKLSKLEQILYHVFLRTYFINSMINPFIYGFMNEEFRAKIKELFCMFCSKHNIKVTGRKF